MQSLSGKLASLNQFLAKSAERALPFFNTLKNITKENKHEYRWTPEAEEAFQQMKRLIISLPSLTPPFSEGDTVCYITCSGTRLRCLSSTDLTDRNGRHMPVLFEVKNRFGLPRIIVTDNGAQLVNEPFKGWCTRFKIYCHETPHEAVIPAEIGIPYYRTLMIREEYNEEEQRLNLDLLQERREAAAICEAKYKTKMEQYYNKRVRPAGFRPGEFMYRRNEASRMEDERKLGPIGNGPYRKSQ
ncbi:reverse transcriptase domain-containing protein [Tanacetum coccineum]|uniref:Reverse transcriptase domain-containing protein n=1 Tax=Tanacetum coccineum TaxID=301880 RepID=A0ABQ4YCU6_9ASTR